MLLLLLLLLLRALWAAAAAAAAAPQQQRRRATRAKRHILAVLADDYGWADAGWHAKMEPAPPTSTPDPRADVRTPVLDSLVSAGIELQRNYVFAVCSPTRSGIQTGRNPLHVNVQNIDPLNWNRRDNVSGFSGAPVKVTLSTFNVHQLPRSSVVVVVFSHK